MSRYARAGGLLLLGAGGLAAAASTTLALSEQRSPPHWIHNKLPSREEQVRRLSQGTAANPYDVLIIGGARPHNAVAIGPIGPRLPPPPPLPPVRPAASALHGIASQPVPHPMQAAPPARAALWMPPLGALLQGHALASAMRMRAVYCCRRRSTASVGLSPQL